MEESEKRKERLQAMRMEAAQAGVDASSDSLGLASGCLSNPLIESETASTAPTQFTSRFGYYTDPMAAFSGSRRNNITPQVSQGYHSTSPRPSYQAMTPSPGYHSPGVNPPGQMMFQGPVAHFNQGPRGSPMDPWGRPQGNPPNPPYGNQGYPPNPPYGDQGYPPNPPYGNQGYPPDSWGGSGGAFNYNPPPPNFQRDGNFSNPSYDRGRGQRFSHYDSGRGRGRSLGNRPSPRSALGGWRGAGSHEPVSAEKRPDLYYRKEMVEDPWKPLTPTIWKAGNTRDSDKSWLPKSISMKKAKVSGEASQISIPQQSLAEYLAASFNDSTNEAVDDNKEGT